MMTYIHACECGAETECEREDQRAGAAFKCPACKRTWGAIFSKGRGQNVWFHLDDSLVNFYDVHGEEYERRRAEDESEVDDVT